MYQILKPTLCKVGAHSFMWASSDTQNDEQKKPSPDMICDCGMYRYADALRMNEHADGLPALLHSAARGETAHANHVPLQPKQ